MDAGASVSASFATLLPAPAVRADTRTTMSPASRGSLEAGGPGAPRGPVKARPADDPRPLFCGRAVAKAWPKRGCWRRAVQTGDGTTRRCSVSRGRWGGWPGRSVSAWVRPSGSVTTDIIIVSACRQRTGRPCAGRRGPRPPARRTHRRCSGSGCLAPLGLVQVHRSSATFLMRSRDMLPGSILDLNDHGPGRVLARGLSGDT